MRKLTYYGPDTLRGDDEIMVAGFDTETDGLGGKLLSIQYGFADDIVFDDSPQMLDNFFEHFFRLPFPVVHFGHFAQYDWRYMMNYIIEHRLDAYISMRNDNDVYQITIKRDGKKYVMRDSYALWNSPLEKLAKSFCPELPKLEIDFDKVVFDPKNPEHISYAIRDVKILLVGLPRLASMLSRHFGVNPNATFASTSVKGWQYTLPKGTKYDSSKYGEQEVFIRQAYYGGLVFLTNTNLQTDCVTYDINSSYPYAMMKYGVPYGRVGESKDYQDGRMGIYRCRVRAPDNLVVAILLARDHRGSMRQYRGTFETVCTNRELIFAAQNGYEIEEIYEGLVWEETIFPFTPFIEKCKSIRSEFKRPASEGMAAEEYLAKFMQNSLYGKFGSRRERFRLMAAHTMSEEDLDGAEAWDENGDWYVKRNELDKDMRCNPSWAVFITAHARLRLLQAVYSAGVENVIYGDTDSITLKKGEHEKHIEAGDDYGQWKREKEWKEFKAIAPKVYSGILSDGRYVGAAKGLPRGKGKLTEKHWRELLTEGSTSAHAMSLSSLRVSMRTGVKPATKLLRKSSTLNNSTNFEQLPNGQVRTKIAA